MITLEQAIQSYFKKYKQGQETGNTLDVIKDSLERKIKNVFEGEKKIPVNFGGKTRYLFLLEYLANQDTESGLPELVKFRDKSLGSAFVTKEFQSAIVFLVKRYFIKIERFDISTIENLLNQNNSILKKYIKQGMGYELINNPLLFKKEIESIRADPDFIFNFENEKLSLKSDIQISQDSKMYERASEFTIDDLIDFKSKIERQKDSLFWIPGNLFNKKK